MTISGTSGSVSDEQAVRDLVQRWMQASSMGDLDTLLDLMTEDVLFLTVNNPPMSRDAFARAFRSMSAAGVELTSTVDTQEVTIHGDVATMSNVVSVATGRRGGPGKTSSGRTLTVLRRGPGGKWRIWRDANLMAG